MKASSASEGTILVTGASGLAGSAVIRELVLLAMSGLLPDRLLDRVRFRVFGMPASFGARRTEQSGGLPHARLAGSRG